EALRARGLACAGVVIGSWPRDPGLADQQNLADLPVAAGVPLAGILPEGAGALARAGFLRVARDGLTPSLGGQLKYMFVFTSVITPGNPNICERHALQANQECDILDMY